MRPYLKDPAAIYAESFAAIAREARIDRFPPSLRAVATRVVHASGMVEVADRLAFSPDAGEAGRAALLRGAPVLCDCEMVAAGVARSRLPGGSEVVVTLNAPGVPGLARSLGTTRSAAAVELWRGRLDLTDKRLVLEGRLTEDGLRTLRELQPSYPWQRFPKGMKVGDLPRLITVGSIAPQVLRVLAEKRAAAAP